MSADSWQLDFLLKSAEYLQQWRSTTKRFTVTAKTTLANVQTFTAIVECVRYLIIKKGLTKVLIGKFSSDPLEKRFGWFRQLSGANFLHKLQTTT